VLHPFSPRNTPCNTPVALSLHEALHEIRVFPRFLDKRCVGVALLQSAYP